MRRYRSILALLLFVTLAVIVVPVVTYATGKEELDQNESSEEKGVFLNLGEKKQEITEKRAEAELSLKEEFSADNNKEQSEKVSEDVNKKQDIQVKNVNSWKTLEETDVKKVLDEHNVLGDFEEENVVIQSPESMLLEKNMNEMLADEVDNIASGEIDEDYGHITWAIDKSGRLTVIGTGDISNASGHDRTPWYPYRKSITSARLIVDGMTDASRLFYNCSNMTNIDMSEFDTSQVTNMYNMFIGCSNLTSLDVSGFNTSRVTDMRNMFGNCSNLVSLDLSSFDTRQVKDMGGMFSLCSNLTSINVSSFDTGHVTGMYSMFLDCRNLVSLDLRNFDTSHVTNMYSMFNGCISLESLDISNFDASQVINMEDMFGGCGSLTKIYTPYNVKEAVTLPSMDGKWKTSDGETVTELPQNRIDSITLFHVKATHITADKIKRSYKFGEKLTQGDLAVTIHYSDGSSEQISDYTTNADRIDMNTAGERSLTITSGNLNTQITITVSACMLDDTCMVMLSKSTFSYNGKAHMPVPTVSIGGVTLVLGRDYSVNYQNNTNVGTADVVITGTGNYTGTKKVHFTITASKQEKPSKPDSSEKPADPSDADTETRPTEPSGSNTTVKPTEPVKPDTSEKPAGSDKPSESAKPKKGDEYTYRNMVYKILSFTGSEGTVEAAIVADKSITSASVPDTLNIGEYSFKVISVKDNAFTGCTKLKTVKLGNNVVTIGKEAFNGCKKLKAVGGCGAVTSIGNKAFYKCEKLVTVGSKSQVITLKKVKTIGNSAFYGCKAVKKVNLSSKVLKQIGASAFQGCTSMTGFCSKSARLTSIGKKAFYGDKKLATVTLKTTKLKKSKVGTDAFKGIKITCKFKVPQKQVDDYKKIFKAKGAGRKVKVIKL